LTGTFAGLKNEKHVNEEPYFRWIDGIVVKDLLDLEN